MIQLRPYQQKIIRSLRESIAKGNKRLIMCSPTGSGKTICFTYLVSRHLEKGGKVIVFTHRKELLTQAGGSFSKFGLKPEYIQAGKNPDLTKKLHVSMIETFYGRDYSEFLKSRTMVIFDESHLENFTKIFPAISEDTIVIGATATPYRKGKNANSLSDFYQYLIQEVDTPDLIDMGFLARPIYYGVRMDLSKAKLKGTDYDLSELYETNQIYEGVVSNWEKYSKNDKTILFASNVKASKRVCEEFKTRGYTSYHLDGKTPKKERESILKRFSEEGGVLCNCGVLTAGFDEPDIRTVILYRATTSLPLYLQMVGRGSRVTPNKSTFKILDFGNNVTRLKWWDSPREWSLEKETSRTQKTDAMSVRICPKCDAMLPVSVKSCIHCGYVFPIKKKVSEEVILEQLSKEKDIPLQDVMKFAGLEKVARERNYKQGWIWHKLNTKEEIINFSRYKGYNPGWAYRQIQNRKL